MEPLEAVRRLYLLSLQWLHFQPFFIWPVFALNWAFLGCVCNFIIWHKKKMVMSADVFCFVIMDLRRGWLWFWNACFQPALMIRTGSLGKARANDLGCYFLQPSWLEITVQGTVVLLQRAGFILIGKEPADAFPQRRPWEGDSRLLGDFSTGQTRGVWLLLAQ